MTESCHKTEPLWELCVCVTASDSESDGLGLWLWHTLNHRLTELYYWRVTHAGLVYSRVSRLKCVGVRRLAIKAFMWKLDFCLKNPDSYLRMYRGCTQRKWVWTKTCPILASVDLTYFTFHWVELPCHIINNYCNILTGQCWRLSERVVSFWI